jgi:hypothetical protein
VKAPKGPRTRSISARRRLTNRNRRKACSTLVSLYDRDGSQDNERYFGYSGPELEQWIAQELTVPQLLFLGHAPTRRLRVYRNEALDESWHKMTALNKVVFSGTFSETSWPTTRISRDDPFSEVNRLKEVSEAAPHNRKSFNRSTNFLARASSTA